jgi:hypothetical protein
VNSNQPLRRRSREPHDRAPKLRELIDGQGLKGVVAAPEGHEGFRDDRVELRAAPCLDLRQRSRDWERASVGAVGRHGVVRVCNGQEERREGDPLALDAVVPAAVVPFVVVLDCKRLAGGEAEPTQDPSRQTGMEAHLLELVWIERAGLLEDRVVDGNLAEVVETA